MKRALLVGPFTGELGHEIYHWSCHIRWLAQTKYPEYDVIVCSFKDRAFLYADFMTRFRPIDWPDSYCHIHSFNFKPDEGFRQRRQELIGTIDRESREEYDEVIQLVPPHQITFRPADDYSHDRFVRFSVSGPLFEATKKVVHPSTVVLLYRQRDLWKLKLDFEVCKTNHDWEREKWAELAELLLDDGYDVVLGGGFWTDAERDRVEEFPCRTVGGPVITGNLWWDHINALETTYCAIALSELSISGPTGINHLQWFTDTPAFVFGCEENYNGSWRQRKHPGTNFLNTPTYKFVTDKWMTGLTAKAVYKEVKTYIEQGKGEGLWKSH